MSKPSSSSLGKMEWKFSTKLISVLSCVTFLFLDLFDAMLCVFYRFVDEFLEGSASPCYCSQNRAEGGGGGGTDFISGDGKSGVSETLFGRKNVFREKGFLGFARKWEDSERKCDGVGEQRWSDCGCESCVSWQKNGDRKLHVVVKDPSGASIEDCGAKPAENVIFLHGMLSSSSFWTETVFPNLSEHANHNHRLFALDLLGFGRSPKPRKCLYTVGDHLEMIEKSVIFPFQLSSFHLVAHSMGCILALALAAKYPNFVKSITLTAPPYFPSSKDDVSFTVLRRFADRRLWPPILFGSSVMTSYEHLGRSICFLICRHHRTWEWILKLLTWKRDLHFLMVDLTRHTHHSAWHTMHNVICGGFMDEYLEAVDNSGVEVVVIQGDRDGVVPLECTESLKTKVQNVRVNIIKDADHVNVVLGRGKDFTEELEHVWKFPCIMKTNGEEAPCLKSLENS